MSLTSTAPGWCSPQPVGLPGSLRHRQRRWLQEPQAQGIAMRPVGVHCSASCQQHSVVDHHRGRLVPLAPCVAAMSGTHARVRGLVATRASPQEPSPQPGEPASQQAADATFQAAAMSNQQGGAASQAGDAPGGSSLPPSLASVWQKLQNMVAAIVAFLNSLLASVKQLPAWVHAQQLQHLRDASDQAPLDADKHAAYLHLLNKSHPKEVLARVESKEYASNAAVVAEYLKALVSTGKLAEYAAAEAGYLGAPGEEQKSLAQLLKELQAQVTAEQPDEAPGSSNKRPLHVVLQGASMQRAATKPLGPLQVVWSLLRTVLLVVFFAFAWLVGSNALRNMKVSQSGLAAGGMSTGAAGVSSASSGSTPSMDPKEYKREELPEKAIRTFKDVKGCDEAKEELKEIVEFLKNPTKFTRLGAKLPKGVLLTGPPGTGKTLLAKAVAGEAGVPFFYRAGSEFEELYVGVGSRRMRALFQAAKKKAPCIVFIDEIDAIGGNRKHWENHTRKTLNQLLVEMDGFEVNEGVIVMAATNLVETLDPALTRPGRFDRQVAVPLPDIKGRTEILEYYLHDKPVAASVDKNLLAKQTQGFSGADISNLVNEAALLAAKQGADLITPGMLDSSFDKISMGVERKSVRRSPDSIKRTAYHEAGHALIATATPGASPVHKATIVPRGHALGMVTQVGRDDEFSINKQQMLARIWVCMGGQVAEELIFGRDQITSGATDDLRQATEMARHMIAKCGLNDVVGPVYFSESSLREGIFSEQVKQAIDEQVRSLLVEAREGVKALMTSRLHDLHALAQALIEQETLTADQITAVLSGQSITGAQGGESSSGGTPAGQEDPDLDTAQLDGVLAGAASSQHAQVAVGISSSPTLTGTAPPST